MGDQPKYEPIIIKIKNGGVYLELPQEPFIRDLQEIIALLEDFIYLLKRKYQRLTGLEFPGA
jgi:hypothetical protein